MLPEGLDTVKLYLDNRCLNRPFDDQSQLRNMMTDTEIRVAGMRMLAQGLGQVEAERFVPLIQREPFDYTHRLGECLDDHAPIEENQRQGNGAEARRWCVERNMSGVRGIVPWCFAVFTGCYQRMRIAEA